MSKNKNDWKKREGIVYSTKQDFDYSYNAAEESDSLEVAKQKLKVRLDTSGRAGKQVTLVEGFIGKQSDLEELAKDLKTKCGVGGSTKDGLIVIQGDKRSLVADTLKKKGYQVRS